MTQDNGCVLLWSGLGFCMIGMLSHLSARHPLVMVRVLTGRRWRRVPRSWQTVERRQAMHLIGWIQLALGVCMSVIGGWSIAG
jgi:hypothetical protein